MDVADPRLVGRVGGGVVEGAEGGGELLGLLDALGQLPPGFGTVAGQAGHVGQHLGRSADYDIGHGIT